MKLIYCFLILSSIFGCTGQIALSHVAEDQRLLMDHKTFWPWEKGRIHYVEKGAGPRHVLFLHGFGANTFTWENQMALFAQEGFHVWAIDFLGFGFSDKPLNAEYSLTLYEEQVGAFLKAKGIERAHIVGNSMGGAVALAFANKNREKVASLILIAPLAYPVKMPFFYSMGKMFGNLMMPFFNRGLVYQILKKIYYDPRKITKKAIDAYSEPLEMKGGKEAMIAILQTFDPALLAKLRPSYPEMGLPLLLIWGREDRWIPVSHLSYFSEDFPNGEQAVIPFCGHAPQEERPEEVNQEVLRFLSNR